MRTALIAGAGMLAVAGAWLAVAGQEEAKDGSDVIRILGEIVDPEMVALGERLYAENCASCHGANLEGQPNWKRRLESGRMPAPPHDATGHTWHHSDADLFRLTKEGVAGVIGGDYQSDMPAFGDVLSDEGIIAVLAFIKSAWPERERGYQQDITKQRSR